MHMIKVHFNQEEVCSLKIDDGATGSDLKAAVAQTINVPTEVQTLTFGGMILEDNIRLSDYKITDSAVVRLFIPLHFKKTINIQVKLSQEMQPIAVYVQPECTVEGLYRTIENRANIRLPESTVLIFKNWMLKCDKTLSFYGIDDGAHISVAYPLSETPSTSSYKAGVDVDGCTIENMNLSGGNNEAVMICFLLQNPLNLLVNLDEPLTTIRPRIEESIGVQLNVYYFVHKGQPLDLNNSARQLGLQENDVVYVVDEEEKTHMMEKVIYPRTLMSVQFAKDWKSDPMCIKLPVDVTVDQATAALKRALNDSSTSSYDLVFGSHVLKDQYRLKDYKIDHESLVLFQRK